MGSYDTIYLDTLVVGATIITDYEVGNPEKVSIDIFDCKLMQNYPNPFTYSTSISYQIGNAKCQMPNAKHSLKIYDILGRLVRTLVDRPITNNQLPVTIYWDGKDESGQEVESGVYFCRLQVHADLETESYVGAKKMILMRRTSEKEEKRKP